MGLYSVKLGAVAKVDVYRSRVNLGNDKINMLLQKNAVALGNLGAYDVQKDDLDRAVPLLERAIQADPVAVDALANLALAFIRLNEPERAVSLVDRALELNPSHALALQIRRAL